MSPYSLKIIRKPVKYLRIQIKDSESIQAVAPLKMPLSKIEDFLESKSSWIEKKRAQLMKYSNFIDLQPHQILLHGQAYTCIQNMGLGKSYHVSHEEKVIQRGHDIFEGENMIKRYKAYAKNLLPHRLDQKSTTHQIPYDRCFIRDQQTKRGTCSTKGHIGLNRRLVKMPTRIMDYVICHELAHRKHMDHSKNFRDHCISLFPKTLEARKWLKTWGKAMK